MKLKRTLQCFSLGYQIIAFIGAICRPTRSVNMSLSISENVVKDGTFDNYFSFIRHVAWLQILSFGWAFVKKSKYLYYIVDISVFFTNMISGWVVHPDGLHLTRKHTIWIINMLLHVSKQIPRKPLYRTHTDVLIDKLTFFLALSR